MHNLQGHLSGVHLKFTILLGICYCTTKNSRSSWEFVIVLPRIHDPLGICYCTTKNSRSSWEFVIALRRIHDPLGICYCTTKNSLGSSGNLLLYYEEFTILWEFVIVLRGIHDPLGICYYFQLRASLSPLRSHKKTS